MYKILFLHSDPKLTQLYKAYLANHFSMDSAHDGLMGLRKIRLTNPHLIISDFHLPRLSGLSLLKYVRRHPTLAATPFLFLTNHQELTEALALGANDWISQTRSSPALLTETVARHLKHNISLLNLR